jgi:hypothetical protein
MSVGRNDTTNCQLCVVGWCANLCGHAVFVSPAQQVHNPESCLDPHCVTRLVNFQNLVEVFCGRTEVQQANVSAPGSARCPGALRGAIVTGSGGQCHSCAAAATAAAAT